MIAGDSLEALFVAWAFLFQIVLIIHYIMRKWRTRIALRYGPIVYGMAIPAFLISILLLLGGQAWYFWIGGFFCLAWGIFGYWVDYVKGIQWRSPPYWPVFIPYIFLYLATIMFYWWPMGLISRPLWYLYALLFILSTVLNVTSHKGIVEEGTQS